jgi:hypothetical protein
MKKSLLLIILILKISCFGNAEIASDLFYGPLWSKSIFMPFSLYYQMPGMKATLNPQGSLTMGLSLVCGQGFTTYFKEYPGQDPVYERLVDFENLILEHIVTYSPLAELEVGAAFNFILLYGGFLDPLISGFHNFFGLPNNKRDIFPENDIYISIPNKNNVFLKLDHAAFGFGDVDIWAKIKFLQTENISFSGLFALKLPTGNPLILQGSGFPDASLGLLFDWYISKLFALYVNCGVIVPYDAIDPSTKSHPFIMANGIFGFEYAPCSWMSVIIQFELRSSPIYSGFVLVRETDIDFFVLPQTNLLIGMAIRSGNCSFQFFFKEDLFTHNAADIVFNIMMTFKVL